MNIAMLTSPLKVWVPFLLGSEIQVRHIPRDEFSAMITECTAVEMKNGEKTGERLDNTRLNDLICERAVTDLRGFTNGDAEFGYTVDNVKLLSSKSSEFVTTVRGVCMDLERLHNLSLESERKNSVNISGPQSALTE